MCSDENISTDVSTKIFSSKALNFDEKLGLSRRNPPLWPSKLGVDSSSVNSLAMEHKEDPFLFIHVVGLDTLYSINLNLLHKKEKKERKEEDEDLRIVFSHETNKQPGSGNPYPLGMGLFVHNSKLHFFGGQNSEKLDNKKVFSFTPSFKPDEPALNPVSTPLIPDPENFSYTMRPIAFTISDKVYALASTPFDGSLVYSGLKEFEKDVFKVFEPNINGNWQWTKLPNPPLKYLELCPEKIPRRYGRFDEGMPIYHSVIKNQLLLQTTTGDFIFDLNDRRWFQIFYREHGIILASLEFKNHVLLFDDNGYLFGYHHESFPYKDDVYKRSSYRPRPKDVVFAANMGSVCTGSLSIVDENSICLVTYAHTYLYVYHLEYVKPPCELALKAFKKFYVPIFWRGGLYTLSSFILKGDAGESNQGSTTGSLHLEGKADQIPYEEELHHRNVMEVEHLLNYPNENDVDMELPTDDEIIEYVLNDDNDPEPDDRTVTPNVSSKEAYQAVITLRNYFLQHEQNTSEVLFALEKINHEI